MLEYMGARHDAQETTPMREDSSGDEHHSLQHTFASNGTAADLLQELSKMFSRLEEVLGSIIAQHTEPICQQLVELRKENARSSAPMSVGSHPSVGSNAAELLVENVQLKRTQMAASMSMSPVTSEMTCGNPRKLSASFAHSEEMPALPFSPTVTVPESPSLKSDTHAMICKDSLNHPLAIPEGGRGPDTLAQGFDLAAVTGFVNVLPSDRGRAGEAQTRSHPPSRQQTSDAFMAAAMTGMSTDKGQNPAYVDPMDRQLSKARQRDEQKERILRAQQDFKKQQSRLSGASGWSANSHHGKHRKTAKQRESTVAGWLTGLVRGNGSQRTNSPSMMTTVTDMKMSIKRGRRYSGSSRPQRPRQMFADVNEMKEKLRQAIGKPKYDVSNFYHVDGWCQFIARASWFEHLTLFIIGLNAIWIAVDTELNDEDVLTRADISFQVVENLFCVYFTWEWGVRFASFIYKTDCFRDGWFVFDTCLVVLMISETWIMSFVFLLSDSSRGGFGDVSVVKVIKLMRITRMARMAKLLVAMPELNILLKGISVAFRSVFFTLMLLVVIIYIFGIAFTQMLIETEVGAAYFKNVFDSMITLLLNCTFLQDVPKVVKGVGEESMMMGAVLVFFVLLAPFTLMNMLIGILCEVVSVVSAVEKENSLLNFVKTRMQEMLTESGLDADGDGMITKCEFEKLIEIPQAARVLHEVGVDILQLVDSADFIFGMDGDIELTFVDFMDVVLQLRNSNNATVKDIVDLHKFLRQELALMEERIHRMVQESLKPPPLNELKKHISRLSHMPHASAVSNQGTRVLE